MDKLKKQILLQIKNIIKEIFGEYPNDLQLSFPPEIVLGDFTIECFSLAEQFSSKPQVVSNKIANKLIRNDLIIKVAAVGPYLNIKINNNLLFGHYIKLIRQDNNLNEVKLQPEKRIMVEYLSPNTNKPLHLGHLRNGAIGMAISRLFESIGEEIIKTNLVNDRGIHICKSMLAWQKWASGSTPESEGLKGDHFVGKWYVRYSQELDKNPELKKEAHALLKKWESNDPETMQLWKTMNEWVYDGFTETYNKFGLEFDAFYYESDTYRLGKDIIDDGIKRKIFSKSDKDNIVFKLPESEFGLNKDGTPKEITVLRHDSTSVYMTQDIATTVLKFKDYNIHKTIFVVGSEQNYHFKCLFTILKALGYKWVKDCRHLSYGMVYLPEGKMKSRDGKVVDADDLIDKITELAAEEIHKRDTENQLLKDEIQTRARKIAVGAIKYYFLSVKSAQDIHFDPKASISFDGSTGPYCQYAYARIFGILDNAKNKNINFQNCDFGLLGNPEELLLLQKLIQFPQEVMLAANELNPSRVTNHIFETAKTFNQFYNKHKVISEKIDPELMNARLNLIRATAIVLKNGLNLIGIEVLKKM